jgi:hypothetical protein
VRSCIAGSKTATRAVAVPGHDVLPAARPVEPHAHGTQQPVAHVVPEAVVDVPETVEVRDDERHARAGLGQRVGDLVGEERAVAEVGELVVRGLVAQ